VALRGRPRDRRKSLKLPIVLLGKAFKPETDIETGSPAMLMGEIFRASGVQFLHVNDINPPLPAVYFIATQNERYKRLRIPAWLSGDRPVRVHP
jgi:hypothetical protein